VPSASPVQHSHGCGIFRVSRVPKRDLAIGRSVSPSTVNRSYRRCLPSWHRPRPLHDMPVMQQLASAAGGGRMLRIAEAGFTKGHLIQLLRPI